MKNLSLFGLILAVMGHQSLAEAVIQKKKVEYKVGSTTLEGVLVVNDQKATSSAPGILVVHDWMGISDDTIKRAEELAKQGYVAFAADMYGKGVRPKSPDEAGKLAGQLKSDRKLLRARAQAALDQLKAVSTVNTSKLVAIGFCFGGTTVLELARSGAKVAGTVSFHGGLSTPTPEDASQIKGKVLVLHGADDPFVPATEVAAFEDEMRKAKVDWQMISYGNAVHAFTVVGAGSDPSKGAAYNATADRRSWRAFDDLMKEL